MISTVKKSIAAGLMISIVSYCNIAAGNKYIGAVLFSFGLIAVCRYSMKLFTGMAGYLNKNNAAEFAAVMVINCATAFLLGAAASLKPEIKEKAAEICGAKLSGSPIWLFASSVLCGILIYIGVDIFKKHNTFIGIIFAIPIFVLCGFDHTVADLFYYGASGNGSFRHIIILIILIAGNVFGSNIMKILLNEKTK